MYLNFNTSHVTVYQSFSHSIITSSHISIHLMLRFIEVAIPALDPITEFQYISCYGLSRTSLTVSLLFQNFNTSHVTVYHKAALLKERAAIFQYISCYGLSNDFKPFLSWHLSSFPLFYVISAFFTSRL